MASWAQVALTDMRKPGWTGSYMTSYAPHDDEWLGRSFYSYASTSQRAALSQGRYLLASQAYSNTNPDFQEELSYDVGSVRSQYNSTRLLPWMHTPLGVTFGLNHAPGYQNNSRILMWDVRVAVKSKATGQWSYFGPDQFAGGMVQTASNRPVSSGNVSGDFRFESSYGEYSCRATNTTAAPHSGYLCWHGWSRFVSVDNNDIADICATCRTALILHDPFGPDDRDFARHMFVFAVDVYPAPTAPSFDYYNTSGTGRSKFVTAKWPNSQFHVMHTMTEAQFNAPGGYPSQFALLEDQTGDPGPGPGPGPGPDPGGGSTIVVPSRGEFQALTEGGAGGFGASAVTNVAASKVRRRRGNRVWG